jgi:hypothetical protein
MYIIIKKKKKQGGFVSETQTQARQVSLKKRLFMDKFCSLPYGYDLFLLSI